MPLSSTQGGLDTVSRACAAFKLLVESESIFVVPLATVEVV